MAVSQYHCLLPIAYCPSQLDNLFCTTTYHLLICWFGTVSPYWEAKYSSRDVESVKAVATKRNS
jgi:hypothetical protein